MITSVFKKSTILSNSLIVVLLLFFFFLYQTSDFSFSVSSDGFLVITRVVLLLASLFLVNFMVKKNGLTKNSSYSILFFLLFFLVFPNCFDNSNLLFANFFLLLAMRRLISLQTLKQPKEKIFDAAMWIFIASLFHFWCILFIILVYVSIIFHVSRDYRNWLLPFVAFFATSVIYFFAALVFDKTWIDHLLGQAQMNFEIKYFANNYENLALSVFAVITVYFLFSMIFSLANRPLVLQAAYKKMIFGVLTGIIVFLISPEKNNAILIFTFMPLAVMGASNIENSQSKMYQEIALAIVILLSFFSFFFQL